MAVVMRLLVGLIGLLSVVSAAQHWFNTGAVMAERGIAAASAMGRANIRADIGGIFLAIGVFAIIAAIRQSRDCMAGALILVASALTGRLISLAIDGMAAGFTEPIIIETAVIAIFAAAWRVWRGNGGNGPYAP